MSKLLDFFPKPLEVLSVVLLWCIFLGATSYFSGWNQLSQEYKTNQPPPSFFLKEQSGRISGVAFKRGINVGVSEEGLYLSIVIFFSLFMSPLLIPWSAISRVESFNDKIFGESYWLDIGNPTIASLVLTRETWQKIEEVR